MQNIKGMFLPGILITSAIATMFIGAALSLAPSGLFRAQLSSNQDAAERAAQAGIEYALARLSANPNWKGDAASDISTPDLFVHEEKGNVVGILRNSEEVSRFRLRFNLQNGTPGNDLDGFDDPSSAMKFDFPLVSFNNIRGNDETVPADAANGRPDPQLVPAHSVYFAVEGTAGRALADLSTKVPNQALTGAYSKKILRCAYQGAPATPNAPDAVTMAANAFKATMPAGSKAQLTLSGDRVPAIRSKVSLTVDGNDASDVNFVSPKNSVFRVPKGAPGNANFGSTSNISRQDEDVDKDAFYQIKWEDVPKAGTAAAKLDAGTYVYSVDASGNGHMHFYDMPPSAYPAYIDAHPADQGTVPPNSAISSWPILLDKSGTTIASGVQVSYDKGKAHFDVSNDVSITPKTGVGANSEFGLIPQKGAAAAPPGDPNNDNSTDADTANASAYTALNSFLNSVDQTNFQVPTPIAQAVFQNLQNLSGVTKDGDEYHLKTADNASYAWTGELNNLPIGSPIRALLQSALSNPTSTPQNAAIAASPLDPEDIEVSIAPAGGKKSVVFSSDGSLTFGAQVDGKSSSIVSGKDIKVIGAGTSIEIPKKSQGLSIYAKGDVTLSSYNPSNGGKKDKSGNPKGQRYNNVSLTGVVYTWGDFKAILGSQTLTDPKYWGSFDLKGTLVAYGGDPTAGPGVDGKGKGKVEIVANGADMVFDSSYLLDIIDNPNLKLTRSWWSLR